MYGPCKATPTLKLMFLEKAPKVLLCTVQNTNVQEPLLKVPLLLFQVPLIKVLLFKHHCSKYCCAKYWTVQSTAVHSVLVLKFLHLYNFVDSVVTIMYCIKVCLAVRASGLESLTFDNPNNLRREKVGKLTNDEYTKFYKSGNVFVSGRY